MLTIEEIEMVSEKIKQDINHIKDKTLQELRDRIPQIKGLLSHQGGNQKSFGELLYYRHLLTLRNKSLLAKMQFKFGDVMEFIRFFFKKWFDIEIKYIQVSKTEFGEEVKMIEITAKQSGKPIGTIVLDLFAREAKTQAKQTLVLQSHTELKMHPETKIKQRPIMLITSAFKPTHTTLLECTIGADDVTTICHELGHCMHNLFSRNNFQLIMGTFPIDYAEMMAILSEKVAESEIHFLMGLQNDELQDVSLQKVLISPIEEFEQLFYALVDLNLHSIQFDSTKSNEELISEVFQKTCEDINRSFGEEIIPKEMHKTAWIFNLDHIVNYGGSYYSYIVASHHANTILQHMTSGFLGSLSYQSDESDPFYRFKLKLSNLYKTGHSSQFFTELESILAVDTPSNN